AGGLSDTVHDVSNGGLAVCLAEMALAGGVGAQVELPAVGSPATALFGESAGRAVVAVEHDGVKAVAEICARLGVPCRVVGESGAQRLVISLEPEDNARGGTNVKVDLDLESLRAAHQRTFLEALG